MQVDFIHYLNNMEVTLTLLFVLFAYLLGSLPTAVWLGEAYFGVDIRQHGSGNSGATNTFRVLGKKAGTIVMLVDILKGWTATSLANILYMSDFIQEGQLFYYQLMLGVVAVVGHIFPVYVKFKGGKGVATLLGMVLAIQTEVALASALVFLIVLVISKYVSLGSMLASLAFPLLLMLPMFKPDDSGLVIFGFAIFAIVTLTHQKNIKRLIKGEESKAKINLKRKINK